MKMKTLKFVGSSLDDLRNFPNEARGAAGCELHAVQSGLEPSDWKPMPIVGSGVREIRIHILGEWRVIYVAKLHEVFMCFMPFKRKREKQVPEILSWRAKSISCRLVFLVFF